MKTTARGLEESNQKILSLAEKNLETAQKALKMLEQLCKNKVLAKYATLPYGKASSVKNPWNTSVWLNLSISWPGRARQKDFAGQYRQRFGCWKKILEPETGTGQGGISQVGHR